MTFKDQMAADVAVFTNIDEFGDTIAHWTFAMGSYSSTSIVGTLIADQQDELQGQELDDQRGRRIVISGRLEIAATISVVVAEVSQQCDYFVINGKRWNAIRIEGSDSAMQAVIVRRDEQVSTKQAKVKP